MESESANCLPLQGSQEVYYYPLPQDSLDYPHQLPFPPQHLLAHLPTRTDVDTAVIPRFLAFSLSLHGLHLEENPERR